MFRNREEAAHRLSRGNKRIMPVRIDMTQEQSVVDALSEAGRNFGKLHITSDNTGVPMHSTGAIAPPRKLPIAGDGALVRGGCAEACHSWPQLCKVAECDQERRYRAVSPIVSLI